MTVRDALNGLLDMNFWVFLFVFLPIVAFVYGFTEGIMNDIKNRK